MPNLLSVDTQDHRHCVSGLYAQKRLLQTHCASQQYKIASQDFYCSPLKLIIYVNHPLSLLDLVLTKALCNCLHVVSSVACNCDESVCTQCHRGAAGDFALYAIGWESAAWEAVATQLRLGEITENAFKLISYLLIILFPEPLQHTNPSGDFRPLCDSAEGRQSAHWEGPAGRCGWLHLFGWKRYWGHQSHHSCQRLWYFTKTLTWIINRHAYA